MSTPEALPCPACGSDSNERDELTKAEREIERLTALAGPSGKRLGELERINDDLIADNERLAAERDALKLTVERLQQHTITTWNAGHTLGVMAGQKALTQAQDALKRDAWGNTQLTEALLAAEAERDALRDALRKAIRQGEHDMLPTGEELREWRAALAQGKEPSNG